MNNLFLVEHDWQVRDFLLRGLKDKGEWIALGPSAMWTLDQKGVKYQIPEDFYSASRLEDICLKNHKRVEWLCNRLDKYLIEKHPEFAEWHIRPFLFSILPLTVLFDGLVSRIFQLKSILKYYTGSSVWVHKSQSYPWGLFEICFSNDELLYGNLLSLPGWNNNINLVEKTKKPLIKQPPSLQKKLKEVINRSIFLHTITLNIKKNTWKEAFNPFLPKKKGTMLVCRGFDEWQYATPVLRERGWRLLICSSSFFLDNRNSVRRVIGSTDWIEGNTDLMSCFKYSGISFYPLLKDRFSWLSGNAYDSCIKIASIVEKTVNKYKVKAFLTTTSAVFTQKVVNQSIKNLNIPVINWQHGFVSYNNGISQLNEYNDLMTCDIFLSYGENVSSGYRQYSDKYLSNVFSVGSGKLDRLRSYYRDRTNFKENNRKKKKVLYVTTNYLQNTWYYGFSPPYSDRFVFRDQLSIMKYLQEIAYKGCDVTVKLHPASTHIDPPWVSMFTTKKGISLIKNTTNFVELLKLHDLVIIDFPTTKNLEAIATGKPVFVLMKHWKYSDVEREMLTRRVVCANTVEALVNAVDGYIKTGNYTSKLSDNTFFKAVGNYLDDGKSTERAVKIVEDSCSESLSH